MGLRSAAIIIYAFFCALIAGAGEPARFQSVVLSSVQVAPAVETGSDRPPGEFAFNVLDAYWVWRAPGTPAVRVLLSDGLAPSVAVDSAEPENSGDAFFVWRKDGRIAVDLAAKNAVLRFRVSSQGRSETFHLSFNLKMPSTHIVHRNACPNYDVTIAVKEGQGLLPFFGVSCGEQEDQVAVAVTRPGGARWVLSDASRDSERVLKRNFKKSGFLGKQLAMTLIVPGGAFVHALLRIEEKKPARERALRADWGGQAALRYFSGSRELDDRTNFFGLKGELHEENQFRNLRSYLEARGIVGNSSFDFREGYLEWYLSDAVRLKIGKEMLGWGRTDEINPTDIFTPRRFGMLFADASTEQKTGAILADLRVSNEFLGTLELVGNAPYIIPSDIYFDQSRLGPVYPARGDQWGGGIRWDHGWGVAETGLMFADAIDPNGAVGLSPDFSLVQQFRRIATVGTDGVIAADRYALRWEIARSWPLGRTYELGERRPELFGVGGFERQWNDGGGGVLLQVLAKKIYAFDQDPFQQTPFEPLELFGREYHLQEAPNILAFSGRVSRTFFNDRLEAEVFIMKEWNTDNYFVRPKLRYTPWDQWKIQAALELYHADDIGIFSLAKKNQLGFVEISRYF